MGITVTRRSLMLSILTFTGLALGGCGGTSTPQPSSPVEPSQAEAAVDDHSGWWCREHGVPEEVCGLCNAKYAAECRQKGDWCDEHLRPKSQCFLCDPALEAKFVAQYKAKYGHAPPSREGN